MNGIDKVTARIQAEADAANAAALNSAQQQAEEIVDRAYPELKAFEKK